MSDTKRAWYYRSWFILPQVIFTPFPWLGLILMWIGKRYPLAVRLVVSGIFGGVGALFLIAVNSAPNPTPNKTEEPAQVLSHDEKVSKIIECNRQYIDPRVVPSNGKIVLDIEAFKKAVENPGYTPPTQENPVEAALLKKLQQDKECKNIYIEIYDKDWDDDDNAYKRAESKYPNDSKRGFSYKKTLVDESRQKILQDYQITSDQFFVILSTTRGIREKEQAIEAKELKEKLDSLSLLGDKLIALEVFPQDEGGQMVRISFKAVGWSASTMRQSILYDTMRVAKQIFTSPETKRVIRIEVKPHADSVDQYGNKSVDRIGYIKIARSLAEKINWENITPDMFEALVSENKNDFRLNL